MRLAEGMAAGGLDATQKGAPFDLLTPADEAIERHLRGEIRGRFPDHGFLGEEAGGATGPNAWQWVVDPIDGTLNYATGLAGAACSIALLRDGEPVVGAIADFSARRVYRSLAGSGVILCDDGAGEADRRPAWSPAGSARIFIEWGWEGLDPVMTGTIEALSHGRSRVLRIVGGAAYAMLNVALHGGCFLGIDLRLWDVAAGIVLAREAGLEVRVWDEETSIHVIAGSADDLRELAPIVERFGSSAGSPYRRSLGRVKT
jgi:fructose-1,6-bisphosphatase/inositol monophosphatase family enzyme